MKGQELIQKLNRGEYAEKFRRLYGEAGLARQTARYTEAVEEFTKLYPSRTDLRLYSASGRTEIGGNHTDHQHGCVLAAAVDLDVIAVVSFHEEGVVRLKSKGYPADEVLLSDLGVHAEESGKSAAIIRGICARFMQMGVKIGGFDAYTTSDVLAGSGLSSSAAFETLLGTIIDLHYNEGRAGALEIAQIGQYAENVYFGKASGLMDQTVSAVGGFVFIDFRGEPLVKRCNFDFEKAGYTLCITDTKGSHCDLTEDYAAIPAEMKHVAAQFGKNVLREVDEARFYAELPRLRAACSDRELLRAAHFFAENRRAQEEALALENNDLYSFFGLVNASGMSSETLLQNCYSTQKPHEQGISLAIMLSKRFLGKQGAVRVHGGGFAGTVQAFVPSDRAAAYAKEMNRVFGAGSCYILTIRPVGGVEI